ncbi:MAG: hypothetical protein ACRC9P_09155 [Bacteroides sp.]
MTKEQIVAFIEALRNSDYYIKYIYTMGGCYQFYKILKTLDSRAMPYINRIEENHIVTRIGGYMYDIDGLVEKVEEYKPLPLDMLDRVEKWSFSRTQMLSVGECPFCEEPIPVVEVQQ